MVFPIFLTVVVVMRNQAPYLERLLTEAATEIAALVSDYELVIIDNASHDDSLAILQRLTGENGLANLQVYVLNKEVDMDTASWVGLENALGDYIAIIDPLCDDIGFLPTMLEHAVNGTEVVFACNRQKPRQPLAYRLAYAFFNVLYRLFSGIHLGREAAQYRILSRRVGNFILQHPQPAIAYRHLPASGGFARTTLSYSAPPQGRASKHLFDSIDRGLHLLVSTTHGPMRLVTSLSLFGAVTNLLYSVYVIAVGLFKTDIAPGWISVSLQQSGMFLLISLVLLMLGEYILTMTSLSGEGPRFYISQEFTSARMTRREKLNVEETLS